MFIINVVYEKPLQQIQAVQDAHREHLDTYFKKAVFIAAGPKVPRDGGLIVANSKVSRAELEAIMAQDPYMQNGLVRYDIVEFNPLKFDPALSEIL